MQNIFNHKKETSSLQSLCTDGGGSEGRSGNICGKQSRERDISEGAEVGVMKRWESGEMLM